MSGPATLGAALAALADRETSGHSYLFHERQPPRMVSHAALWRRAQRCAAALQALGVARGDRVGLILPDASEFIDCILGAMLAGAIAVPVYPPLNLGQLDAYLGNTGHIVRQAGCSAVITDAKVRAVLGGLIDVAPGLRVIETLAGIVRGVTEGAEPAPVIVRPDDVAFLQFTSGSTAQPRGVTLTHANLMANIAAIGAGLQVTDESIGVSWLPLYHDMGLIGFVFAPLVFAARRVLFIPPQLFLKRPALWLRQLAEQRASITFAPNFAYGLCTARIKDAELEGVDLSALKIAGCGAEPIQAATLRGFAERFAGHGFDARAFVPGYGMAEHTVAVSFAGLGRGVTVDRVDAEALTRGEARPVKDEDPALEVVCCGRVFAGHALRIVDAAGAALGERQVGQIELQGPSVMAGYWDDPERSAAALQGGWLRTGDLGYLADGELYVCGRSKDLIIVHGRNFHPQDLEWQASQVPGVRRGNVVAFGLQHPELGREHVVVAAELRAGEVDEHALRASIGAQIQGALGLVVDEIVLLPAGSLPKTSSGKLQRSKTAALFVAGELGKSATTGKLGLLRRLAASRWSLLRASLSGRDE